jgi:hypothetical protein
VRVRVRRERELTIVGATSNGPPDERRPIKNFHREIIEKD